MDKNMEVMKGGSTAIQISEEPSAGQMMSAMIQAGITTENVAAFKELVLLQERAEDRRAKREFASAFSALQAELPAIQANKAVPNNDGTVRYKFAPYEEILKQVKPYLDRHGFSLRFSQKMQDKLVVMTCQLLHKGGHFETNDFSCRIGSGPPKSNESQADGAASSYAQRGALCDALNIVVRNDSDARIEGAPIDKEDAEDFRRRAKAAKINEADLLEYAQAKSFEEISTERAALVDEFLRKREKADPTEVLRTKLWNLLEAYRGNSGTWTEIVAKLVEWKILTAGQKFKDLTVDQLQGVIDKVEIKLAE